MPDKDPNKKQKKVYRRSAKVTNWAQRQREQVGVQEAPVYVSSLANENGWMPEVTVSAGTGLTDYDLARAERYRQADGTLSAQGMEFLKNVSAKRTTGKSQFMQDFDRLAAIPNAAVGLAGVLALAGAPAAAGYLMIALGGVPVGEALVNRDYGNAAKEAAVSFLPLGAAAAGAKYIPKVLSNYKFIKKVNDAYPAYSPIPLSNAIKTKRTNNAVRARIAEDNTYVRGVRDTDKLSDDVVAKALGKNTKDVTLNDRLEYMATHYAGNTGHGRVGFGTLGKGEGTIYTSNSYSTAAGYASINGSNRRVAGEANGKIAIVRRPYTLGPDRNKWIEEATVPLIHVNDVPQRALTPLEYFRTDKGQRALRFMRTYKYLDKKGLRNPMMYAGDKDYKSPAEMYNIYKRDVQEDIARTFTNTFNNNTIYTTEPQISEETIRKARAIVNAHRIQRRYKISKNTLSDKNMYQHYIFYGKEGDKGLDFVRFLDPQEYSNVDYLTRSHVGKATKGLSRKQYQDGGGTSKTAKKKTPNLTPLDLATMYENNASFGGNRYLDTNLLRAVDNQLIKRGMPLPQRMAIASTAHQEGSRLTSHGNGAFGLFGFRGARAENLPSTAEGQADKIYDETFGVFNPDNWNHGGKGSGYNTAKEAQQAFVNATTPEEAMRALTYGYVRPPQEDRKKRVTNVTPLFTKRKQK